MPTPAAAPPRVIDFSCGTTQGITRARAWRPPDRRRSSCLGRDARSRDVDFHHLVEAREIDARARLPLAVAEEVRRALARPIPPGPPASSARSRASLLSWLFTGVEEGAAHRIVVADVAFAHYDLEEVRLAMGERNISAHDQR